MDRRQLLFIVTGKQISLTGHTQRRLIIILRSLPALDQDQHHQQQDDTTQRSQDYRVAEQRAHRCDHPDDSCRQDAVQHRTTTASRLGYDNGSRGRSNDSRFDLVINHLITIGFCDDQRLLGHFIGHFIGHHFIGYHFFAFTSGHSVLLQGCLFLGLSRSFLGKQLFEQCFFVSPYGVRNSIVIGHARIAGVINEGACLTITLVCL